MCYHKRWICAKPRRAVLLGTLNRFSRFSKLGDHNPALWIGVQCGFHILPFCAGVGAVSFLVDTLNGLNSSRRNRRYFVAPWDDSAVKLNSRSSSRDGTSALTKTRNQWVNQCKNTLFPKVIQTFLLIRSTHLAICDLNLSVVCNSKLLSLWWSTHKSQRGDQGQNVSFSEVSLPWHGID